MPEVAIIRTARLEPPRGLGVGKIVDAKVNALDGDTVAAGDLGLKTIYSEPHLTSRELAYVFMGSTNTPGSPMNYVTIRIEYIGTAGGTGVASGSHSCALNVVGE